jgi:IS5 family transposase
MKQQTLTGFEKYGKTTRRAQFLADMDKIIPWTELAAAVQTAYPKVSESGGRPPIPLERMLRIYFLQLWFNLSDPAVEESLYDSVAMRAFVGIDLGTESAPDETTVCNSTRMRKPTPRFLRRHSSVPDRPGRRSAVVRSRRV